MPTPTFDLPAIVASVRRRSRLVVTVTLIAAAVGALFYFVSPPHYTAHAEILLRNPLYSDRNNLYNYDGKFIDYFASEDDVNRLVAMSSSSAVQGRVIRNMNLAEAYKVDTTLPGGMNKMYKRFEHNLNVMRTENKDLTLSYTDQDPVRAAAVANNTIEVLEETFNGFYKEMRGNMYKTVTDKIHYEDSAIRVLTDSIVALRQQYSIYEIISPTRHNIMLSSTNKTGSKEYARGLEEIQNIESIKDEMVSDRALSLTLANQYASGQQKGDMPMLKVITPAATPHNRAGLSGLLIVIASGLVGLFFSIILVLIADNFFLPKNN